MRQTTLDLGVGEIPAVGETLSWAEFSPCGWYRYLLGRRWADGPLLPWILLNPSTADALTDDPTIRACCQFAKALGFAGTVIGNVYAFRATNPNDMDFAEDPVGPANDYWLHELVWSYGCDWFICGWGDLGAKGKRAQSILRVFTDSGRTPKALRQTKAGNPMHPLRLPRSLKPFRIGVTP